MADDKVVTLYEREGAVHRKVQKELGGGQRVVTSDIEFHPDAKEFAQDHPNVRIVGFHPQTEEEVASPGRFTLDELPDFLAGVDSVDVLLRLRRIDDRKMAGELYEDRLEELLEDEGIGADDDE